MERITDKHLDGLIHRINILTNSPQTSYTRTDNKLKANIGNYHISSAYGGVQCNRMVTEGGGVVTVSQTGYTTKRALYNELNMFIRGLETHE